MVAQQPLVPPPPPADGDGMKTETYQLAQIRSATEVVLLLDDGRMFTAAVPAKVKLAEDATELTVKHDGLDDGVPINPIVQ